MSQSDTGHTVSAKSGISLLWILCTALFALLLSTHSLGQTRLNASVDRNSIYETDTVNLRISGEVDVDFSLGGLLNFGRSDIASPKIDGLEDDFEVLDQQQQYNMQSINGETKAQVTWNYVLAPKRTGTLTIPAADYNDASTEVIKIEVTEGSAPKNSDEPPLVFLEVEVDKHSVYVQEQVLYTLRLYAADHLASGDLSQPEPTDAIVEALGDTQKYFRMAYNQRYEVRERQYLIFPQKSGELTIRPQTFSGMLINTRTRQRMRVRELSKPVSIDVKAPPAEFSGDLWLPATSFHLSEKWEPEPNGLYVGDSLTRTLEIKALGLLGSALPPISTPEVEGLKVYPDQPFTESYEHETGAQSVRRETHALVAVTDTTVTLPEISIPWWDTINDVERVARIPARTFTIEPNPAVKSGTAAQPETPTKPENSSDATNDSGTIDSGMAPATQSAGTSEPDNQHGWYLIVALLLSGWIATTWYLLKYRKPSFPSGDDAHPATESRETLKTLTRAIQNRDSDMPKRIIAWLNRRDSESAQRPSIESIADTEYLYPQIHRQLSAFETERYGPAASSGHASGFDAKALIAAIKEADKVRRQNGEEPLKPFYPDTGA